MKLTRNKTLSVDTAMGPDASAKVFRRKDDLARKLTQKDLAFNTAGHDWSPTRCCHFCGRRPSVNNSSTHTARKQHGKFWIACRVCGPLAKSYDSPQEAKTAWEAAK